MTFGSRSRRHADQPTIYPFAVRWDRKDIRTIALCAPDGPEQSSRTVWQRRRTLSKHPMDRHQLPGSVIVCNSLKSNDIFRTGSGDYPRSGRFRENSGVGRGFSTTAAPAAVPGPEPPRRLEAAIRQRQPADLSINQWRVASAVISVPDVLLGAAPSNSALSTAPELVGRMPELPATVIGWSHLDRRLPEHIERHM